MAAGAAGLSPTASCHLPYARGWGQIQLAPEVPSRLPAALTDRYGLEPELRQAGMGEPPPENTRPSRSQPVNRQLLLLGATLLTAAPAAAQVNTDGPFTEAQAERGRRIFGAFCATCHGSELEGAVGPALAGGTFADRWSRADASVADLFTVMRTTMPRPAAGSLADASYLQLLAYILSRNGIPAGNRDLTADRTALAAIRIPVTATEKKPAPDFVAGDSGITPSARLGPDAAALRAADTSTDWPMHLHDYAGTRYSPLRQITGRNAGRLQAICSYQVGAIENFLTGPVVWRGVMYLTTPELTMAIDAATCREKWRYKWDWLAEPQWKNHRGVAVQDGYVVRGTADGYLLALDAATGRLLWARHVGNSDAGETFTMPPLIIDSLVIIGPAGSENNAQGWIGAFRLTDGTPVWRFNTIPRPGEPGAETWRNAPDVPVGGGGIWTSPTYDPARGELYVAVTNPAPDLPRELRPGENLYTNSVVTLDVRTGKLRWYASMVPGDFHDWDLTQAAPALTLKVDGEERPVLVTVGKEGMLRAIDRNTRERLYEVPVTTRRNVDLPLTKEGVEVCPGVLGGVEWSGPAYNPDTGLLYTPAVDWCSTFGLSDTVRLIRGRNYMGGTIKFGQTKSGWLTATDAVTGKVRWRYHSTEPMVGAVTTTAGGVVLTGEGTGDFLVLGAADGRELYRFNTGGGIGGGVVTYAVAGRQYIATTSGRSGFFFGTYGSPTIFVFGLRP